MTDCMTILLMAKILSGRGPWEFYQMGVRGLICVGLGVLDVKKVLRTTALVAVVIMTGEKQEVKYKSTKFCIRLVLVKHITLRNKLNCVTCVTGSEVT